MGNARVIFNAQPSMPLAQWATLGQTLLVFSYRSAAELLNLLANLTGISEISLWCEQQSVALHIVNQIKVLPYRKSNHKPHCNYENVSSITDPSHLGQWVRFIRARI